MNRWENFRMNSGGTTYGESRFWLSNKAILNKEQVKRNHKWDAPIIEDSCTKIQEANGVPAKRDPNKKIPYTS